ncbi:hypothetical protein [Mucilaginibacter phyllosphaerae]
MEMYKNVGSDLQIAENAISVISQHGVEHVSFKLISIATKISVGTISDSFGSLDHLIAFCLTLSFDSLAQNLAQKSETQFHSMNDMEDFWITLVEFNTAHCCKGRLIAAYFKSPASYPLVNAKYCLSRSVNRKFQKTDHVLKYCNSDIRFIAFAYLFQMAYKLSVDLPNSIEKYGPAFVSNFYHKNVAEELTRFSKLPLS